MTRPTPDLMLERLRLGELDPVAAERLKAAMSPEESARLDAMDAEDAELIALHPPRVVAVEVERRARPASTRRRWVWAAPVLAAAAVALLVWPTPERIAPEPAVGVAPTERAKGGDRLLVYRKVGDAIESLADGAHARPGDVLQLAVLLGADRYVAVVSVDGRGTVTRHFPVVDGPAGLQTAGRVPLDHAFALDDAPEYERFVLVTAPEPFDPSMVGDALREIGGGSLSLPDGWTHDRVDIVKEGAR